MKNKKIIYLSIIGILIIILGILVYFVIKDDSSNNNYGLSSDNSITSNSNSGNNADTSNTVTFSKSEVFTDRDLKQTADLSSGTTYNVSSNNNINITKEGVYVITGTAENVTIYVEAGDEDKVQLVFDELNITNSDFPCIYVKSGDKVFITTNSNSSLSVTENFKADGDTNTDGVIFSKSDIVLNGTGNLTINSTDNGVVSKDDLKVTGGTYTITATSKGIQANDLIAVADGELNITAGTDGLHSEYDEDDSVGHIYICGGTLNIKATDDGIHGTSIVQIDDGTITIGAAEGIEGTYIKINGGTIKITATDDGINAAKKSTSYQIAVEINGGDISINMGQGDTDAIDSNGNIYINGGTLNITANSPFDYDGTATKNGGTIIVNSTETDEITNQFMGGGAPGGMPGDQGQQRNNRER